MMQVFQGMLFEDPVTRIKEPSSCQIGTAKEMIVMSNLLKRGFAVFERKGNGGSPDLCAMGPDFLTFSIEVKSPSSANGIDWNKADILAIVDTGCDVSYYCRKDNGNRSRCDIVEWYKDNVGKIESRLDSLEQIIDSSWPANVALMLERAIENHKGYQEWKISWNNDTILCTASA